MKDMTTIQNFDGTDDFSVFVAFHVSNEISLEAAIARLKKTSSKLFDTQYFIDSVGNHPHEYEIILRFQKPIMASNGAYYDFFDSLKDLFITTSDLSPHFTQATDRGESQI